MKNKNFKKLIFIGLILMSFVQIIQHLTPIPDFIYGSLMGATIAIMLVGLVKSIKLKNSTSNC